MYVALRMGTSCGGIVGEARTVPPIWSQTIGAVTPRTVTGVSGVEFLSGRVTPSALRVCVVAQDADNGDGDELLRLLILADG